MGGTSLLFTSAAFGMILSVSHTFQEDGEVVEEESEVEEVEESAAEEAIEHLNR